MLAPPDHTARNVRAVHEALHFFDQALDDAFLALTHLLDFFFDLMIRLRLQIAEREIVELNLDTADTESVCERRINLQGFLRLFSLFLRLHVLQGAHVVKAVRELNQNDTDVLGHGEEHSAKVLGLDVESVIGPSDVGELGNAVHHKGDIIPEDTRNLFLREYRVLDDIVQKSRDDTLLVELQVRENNRDTERVDDVGLAGLPLLVHMRVFRGHIGAMNERGVIGGMIALDGCDQLLIEYVRVCKFCRFFQFSLVLLFHLSGPPFLSSARVRTAAAFARRYAASYVISRFLFEYNNLRL